MKTLYTNVIKSRKKRKAYQLKTVEIPYEIAWIIEHINNPIAGFEHLSNEGLTREISRRKQITATHQQLKFMAADLYSKGKSEGEILSLLKYYMY